MIDDFKPVAGFPNYQINTEGVVCNNKGKILKQELTRNGYLRVSLSNDRVKHKRKSVHRLVAETFIPNPNNHPQVDHFDENKTNNRVDNLRWSTPLNNLNHSHVIDKASIAKEHKVRCIDTGRVYDSIKEAAEDNALHHSNIVACCNGRRHTCGGLRWQYED